MQNKLTLTYAVIGFTLFIVGFVAACFLGAEAYNTTIHVMFAFGGDVPLWLPPSNTTGRLPAAGPALENEYDENIAMYLGDAMTRYMLALSQQTPQHLARTGTFVRARIFTEGGEQLSCLVLDDPEAGASVVLFKGTVTRAEWATDFSFGLGSASGLSGKTKPTHRFLAGGRGGGGRRKRGEPREPRGERVNSTHPHRQTRALFSPGDPASERIRAARRGGGGRGRGGRGELRVVCRAREEEPPDDVLLHKGFLQFYLKMRPELLTALEAAGRKNVYICGHSLGAGVANICLYDMLSTRAYEPEHAYAVTIAAPRVGNPAFAECMAKMDARLFQLRNSADMIPTLPLSSTPSLSGEKVIYAYKHAGTAMLFSERGVNLKAAHMLDPYQRNMAKGQLSEFRY